MRCPRLLAAALLLPSGLSAAEIAIAHAATGSPADHVASAELQFRGEGGDWYSVAMARAGAGFEAYLPRPTRRMARVEYRVVMTGADAKASATPAHALAVDPACGSSDAVVEVAAPIVIRVPPGAPPVPPVPAGFSPAGVVAAEEKRGLSTGRKLLAGAALAGAIGAGTAVVATSEPPPAISAPIEFTLFDVQPSPGNVITASGAGLFVAMRVVGGERVPGSLIWDVELFAPGVAAACARMRGVAELGAGRPGVVFLDAPLEIAGPCGQSFDVDRLRILIVFEDAVAYDQVHALPYRVQP